MIFSFLIMRDQSLKEIVFDRSFIQRSGKTVRAWRGLSGGAHSILKSIPKTKIDLILEKA